MVVMSDIRVPDVPLAFIADCDDLDSYKFVNSSVENRLDM